MKPPVHVAIALELANANSDSVEHLDFLYRCWLKRERGESLDEYEEQFANDFTKQREQACLERDRSFLFRLDDVFNPGKPKKVDLRKAALFAYLQLAKSSPTFSQIRQQVEQSWKLKRHRDTWRRLRISHPFCDLPD